MFNSSALLTGTLNSLISNVRVYFDFQPDYARFILGSNSRRQPLPAETHRKIGAGLQRKLRIFGEQLFAQNPVGIKNVMFLGLVHVVILDDAATCASGSTTTLAMYLIPLAQTIILSMGLPSKLSMVPSGRMVRAFALCTSSFPLENGISKLAYFPTFVRQDLDAQIVVLVIGVSSWCT